MSDFIDKINYFNDRLKEGKTVSDIRKELGISEKLWQKSVKNGGYKYDQKDKQYIVKTNTDANTICNTTTDIIKTTNTNTNTITNAHTDIKEILYLIENFDIIKTIVDKFKQNTVKNSNNIIIDLVDDRNIKSTPKAIRVNHYVWEQWTKFCEENNMYEKKELISMALKEYVENHK